MRCASCSHEYPDSYKFCPACGVAKDKAPHSSVIRASAQNGRAFFSKKRIVVAGCVVVAAIALTLGLIFGLSDNGSKWNSLPALGSGNGNTGIDCLASDPDHGILYEGTGDSGVWRFSAGKWSAMGGPPAERKILALTLDPRHGALYAGTDGLGVWKYQSGHWSDTHFILQRAVALACDQKNSILYADGGVGIWELRNNGWSFTHGGYGMTALMCGSDTVLYAGSTNQSPGIWAYRNGGWWTLNGPVNEPGTNETNGVGYEVNGIACDPVSGALYAATSNQGTWRCDNPTTAPAWTRIGMDSLGARSLFLDRGVLYAASDSGVSKYVGGKWSSMGWPGKGTVISVAGGPGQGGLFVVASHWESGTLTFSTWQYK